MLFSLVPTQDSVHVQHFHSASALISIPPTLSDFKLILIPVFIMFVSPGYGSERSSVAQNTNTWLVHCPVCFLGLQCRDRYTVQVKYSSRCPGNAQIPVQNFPQTVKSLCAHELSVHVNAQLKNDALYKHANEINGCGSLLAIG